MAMVWRNSDLSGLATSLKGHKIVMERRAAEIVEEVISEGSNNMRRHIETRGTGYRGHTGRIETGAMLENVGDSSGQIDISAGSVSGKFGWGTTGGDVQPYYSYQEQGFTNWRTGRDVPPMHALLDAFITARISLMKKINKATRK